MLIVMVVYGHVVFSGSLRQFFYSFHMPAFFIISGMLLKQSSALCKPYKEVLCSKTVSLLVPLMFFELFGILTNILQKGTKLNFFGYATNTLTLDLNCGEGWFLWSLFIGEALLIGLLRLIRHRQAALATSCLLAVLMILGKDVFPRFGPTGFGLLFLVIGFCASDMLSKKYSVPTLIFACAVSIASCFLNGKVDLIRDELGNCIFLYFISAVSGSIFLFQFCMRISSGVWSYFGKNTLTVLGTHDLFILPLKSILGTAEFPLWLAPLVFFGTLLIECGLIPIANRVVPLFVGKRKPVTVMDHILCSPGYVMVPLVVMLQILIWLDLFAA